MNQNNATEERCLEDCRDCSIVCFATLAHCLNKGGRHADADHIALMQTCAIICQASASLMALRSPFASDHCEVCARVCDQCAEDCEAFTNDDQMRLCAEMCRQCAASCQGMGQRAAS